MSNLIDKDKLIDELKQFHWTAYQPLSAHPCEYADAVRIVFEQQTISNSPCYPDSPFDWISIDDRNPDEEGLYLTVIQNIKMGYYYMTCKYDGRFPKDVIAWMPIKPYTGHKEQI